MALLAFSRSLARCSAGRIPWSIVESVTVLRYFHTPKFWCSTELRYKVDYVSFRCSLSLRDLACRHRAEQVFARSGPTNVSWHSEHSRKGLLSPTREAS